MMFGLLNAELTKSLTILSIFFVSLFFIACENDPTIVKNIGSNSKLPAQKIINAEILYSDSGIVKAKINAPLLEYYSGDNPYTEFKKGLKMVLLDKDKKPETQMKANYAIKNEKENIIEAKNDVVVKNERGETLNTEHLIWDEGKDLIKSDAFVKITTPDKIIMGDGLESNQSFTKYKILKIKGTINLKDDGKND